MSSFNVLVSKEFRGFVKEYKVIWVPIVFIGICILQPITMNMLPSLIGNSDGVVIDASFKQTGDVIFSGVFTQLNQLGIIIVSILLVGAINNEKTEGIMDIMLSKPISSKTYIFSKYISYMILILVSLFAGSLFGLYYTQLLFSKVSVDLYIWSMLSYSLWFMFIITLGVLMSCVAKTQLHAALLTSFIGIVLMVFSGVLSNDVLMFLPSSLSANAISIANGSGPIEHWKFSIFIVIIEIMIVLTLSVTYMYKRYQK